MLSHTFIARRKIFCFKYIKIPNSDSLISKHNTFPQNNRNYVGGHEVVFVAMYYISLIQSKLNWFLNQFLRKMISYTVKSSPG